MVVLCVGKKEKSKDKRLFSLFLFCINQWERCGGVQVSFMERMRLKWDSEICNGGLSCNWIGFGMNFE